MAQFRGFPLQTNTPTIFDDVKLNHIIPVAPIIYYKDTCYAFQRNYKRCQKNATQPGWPSYCKNHVTQMSTIAEFVVQIKFPEGNGGLLFLSCPGRKKDVGGIGRIRSGIIDDENDTFELEGCISDFQAISKFSKNLGLSLHSDSLIDTRATSEVAKDRLNSFFQLENKSYFIVCFAGHGSHDQGGWCFYGNERLTPASVASIWNSHHRNKQSTLYLIIDSCFSGMWVKYATNNPQDFRNIVIQTSCSENQVAQDGLFLQQCLEGYLGRIAQIKSVNLSNWLLNTEKDKNLWQSFKDINIEIDKKQEPMFFYMNGDKVQSQKGILKFLK